MDDIFEVALFDQLITSKVLEVFLPEKGSISMDNHTENCGQL